MCQALDIYSMALTSLSFTDCICNATVPPFTTLKDIERSETVIKVSTKPCGIKNIIGVTNSVHTIILIVELNVVETIHFYSMYIIKVYSHL